MVTRMIIESILVNLNMPTNTAGIIMFILKSFQYLPNNFWNLWIVL